MVQRFGRHQGHVEVLHINNVQFKIVTLPETLEPLIVANPTTGLGPLTARSVIATTLLGSHHGELSAGRLVRTAALFDISASATRTALSRMKVAGELESDNGKYRLAGALLQLSLIHI